MSAIRLARGFTRRDRIIKFAGCYHGHSDGLLASAGSGLATLGIPSSPGVPTGTTGDTVVTTYNDLDATAAAVERYGEGLAAIIVEPVAGNMGVVPPAPGFLEALRALCDASGALLIFDEVITGFRVARGGAQERYGVLPDLTILGKIVGGGLPAAAFGGRADVMERLAPAGDVYQAGTLSGNPLATAAGISVLRRLREPAVYEELERKGARLEAGLAPFGRVQRVGAMATLFLADAADPELRGREDERRRALRRSVPAPARARDLRRAVAVRVPVRLARALRRGHRPHRRGSWRLLPRLSSVRRDRCRGGGREPALGRAAARRAGARGRLRAARAGALRARARDDLRGLPRPLRPAAALLARGGRRRAPARRLPLRARARPDRGHRRPRRGGDARRADLDLRTSPRGAGGGRRGGLGRRGAPARRRSDAGRVDRASLVTHGSRLGKLAP